MAEFTVTLMLEREISMYLLKERINLRRMVKFGGINQDKAYFSRPKSFNAKVHGMD